MLKLAIELDRRLDTQHNDNQQDDIQYYDTQNKGLIYDTIKLIFFIKQTKIIVCKTHYLSIASFVSVTLVGTVSNSF
jgi:hypothetical protein